MQDICNAARDCFIFAYIFPEDCLRLRYVCAIKTNNYNYKEKFSECFVWICDSLLVN